ncbi:hypothetical protein U7230_13840 [Carboxydochorda subterranea]|uniref:Uncharacterized protein n=1 Tax=Carboxydichorda subterranea TaxID=3109565 RepID=A0ABZ1BXD3_9FIRM|nr:hypothetical protein [Limnochorda sp. L945t]WRP17150.1 hypothetical protein U7230_13840 [Limnochorda sp. L945t]
MRAVMPPGEQRRFLRLVMQRIGAPTLRVAAERLSVSLPRLRGWHKEHRALPAEFVAMWSRTYDVPVPPGVRFRPENGFRDPCRGVSPAVKARIEEKVEKVRTAIERYHWGEGMSLEKLGPKLGYSSGRSLRNFCKQHGIPTRSFREAMELAKRQKTFGRPHTPEVRQRLSQLMHQRYASGWVATGGRCKKLRCESPYAGSVTLDGNWELLVARSLDRAGIPWVRNRKGYPYTGRDGKLHRYFPDFYLPELDLFLEVKGYVDPASAHKLRCFHERYPGRLVLLTGKRLFNALAKGQVDIVEILEDAVDGVRQRSSPRMAVSSGQLQATR